MRDLCVADVVGKTVASVQWIDSEQDKDAHYLVIAFTDGAKLTVAGSGNMGDDGVFVRFEGPS